MQKSIGGLLVAQFNRRQLYQKTYDNVGKGLKSILLHRQYSTKTQRAEFAKIPWSVLSSKSKKPVAAAIKSSWVVLSPNVVIAETLRQTTTYDTCRRSHVGDLLLMCDSLIVDMYKATICPVTESNIFVKVTLTSLSVESEQFVWILFFNFYDRQNFLMCPKNWHGFVYRHKISTDKKI